MNTILKESIEAGLLEAEKNGSIVISTTNISTPVDILSKHIQMSDLRQYLSLREVEQLTGLILHAINDERFFDWEMPTRIGATREEIKKIGDKLDSAYAILIKQESILEANKNSNT